MKYLWTIAILLVASSAWAASESQTAGSYDQGTNWNTPGNITGSGDNSCAFYSGDQDIITVYNFGFSSVTGTVDSINIAFDMYASSAVASNREIEAQPTKTGGTTNTGVGNLVEDIQSPQLADCTVSAALDEDGNILWGTTWTAAEIMASGFGFNLADDDAAAAWFGFDAVTVTVYYTPDSGAKSIRIRKVAP